MIQRTCCDKSVNKERGTGTGDEEPERGTRNRNGGRGTGTGDEEPERGTRNWNGVRGTGTGDEEPERGTRNRNGGRGTGTGDEEPERGRGTGRGTRPWNEARETLRPYPNSVTGTGNEDPPCVDMGGKSDPFLDV